MHDPAPAIRRATPDDAGRLSRLAARSFTEAFGHNYPPEDLAAFIAEAYAEERQRVILEHPDYAVWLLEEGGEAVGHAAAGPCGLPHPDVAPGDGELKRLYVLASHQGTGWGGRLFDAAMEWLEREGPRTLWIGVWSRNPGAQRFYARRGFGKVGDYFFPVGATRDHEFILRRPAGAGHRGADGAAGDPAAARHVLLVHGLWMPPLAMRPLAARLAAQGFEPRISGYRSIVGSTEAAVRSLRDRLRGGPPTHIVGHSLGGLVALEALRAEPALPVRRIVCLGTPLCGSGAARALSRQTLVALYLGRSAALLRGGCLALPAGVEIGMVAGDRPRGLGALVARFEGPHDGTVSVDETRNPSLADHVVLDASHTGLLFSPDVAAHAAAFLRSGRFPTRPAPRP